MKLFVWVEPYDVNYGGSWVIAVAETVEEARLQAAKGKMQSYGQYDQGDDMSRYAEKLGEPTRILDVPCAEWYEWSE